MAPPELRLLARALRAADRLPEALELLETGASRHPDEALLWAELGVLRGAAGQPQEADAALSRAEELASTSLEVLGARAAQLHAAGRLGEALQRYGELVRRDAASPRQWYAIGCALSAVGEPAQAVEAYEQALADGAAFPEVHQNLGAALYRLGEVDRALSSFESAARAGGAAAWVNAAVAVPGAPSADGERVLEVRRRCARHLESADPARRDAERPPATRTRERLELGRPLRVGFLSSFFHRPPWMKPVWGTLSHLDRTRLEVHLLADRCRESDVAYGWEPGPADRFHETGALANGALEGLVGDLELDLLVDLNGYSDTRRLGLWARPPAPVTLTWFNSYATTALPGIDFIVGDPVVVRPGEEPHYTEEVLRVPTTYLGFRVDHPVPAVVPPPCTQGAPLTFGSLATLYKLTPEVLDAWARILRDAPGTRLLLAARELQSETTRRWLADRFRARGVEESSLLLRGPRDHLGFLRYYDEIDVALDPAPYNGGTTTMEALWQGVPVLAVDGDRWAARTSLTLLRAAGLEQGLVSSSLEELAQRAVDMARDPHLAERLAAWRSDQRERVRESPACDTRALGRGLTEALLAAARHRPSA